MRKREGYYIKRYAIFQIFLMIMASFAVSFLFSEQVGFGSAISDPNAQKSSDADVGNVNEALPPKEVFKKPITSPAVIPSGATLNILKDSNPNKYSVLKDTKVNIIDLNTGETADFSLSDILKNDEQRKNLLDNPTSLEDKGIKIYDSEDGTSLIETKDKFFRVDNENGDIIHSGTLAASGSIGAYEYKTLGGFGPTINNFLLGNIVQGVAWASVAVGIVQSVGALAGLDSGTTKALSFALAGGILAGKAAIGLFGKATPGLSGSGGIFGQSLSNGAAFGIGLGVAAAIFILTYEKKSNQVVTFNCLPYEPPLGGAKCEECNKDPFRPCSEYRCRALGQACQLLNTGTGKEQCAWVHPKDVESPKIAPWESALSPRTLKYVSDKSIRPPALGVKIVDNGGCLPAFTPLEFGITTNEPAQCKIEYNRTGKFDSMQFYFGDSNFYEYNHTQKMRLPSPEVAGTGTSGPVIKNDGTFSLYVRCRDSNGNENVDEYAVNFCVVKGPDTTPPVIEATDIPSGSFIQYKADVVPIQVYTNEPADCRWSRDSKAYSDMENGMGCSENGADINANLLYTCAGNLTGIKDREQNKFYFRCQDKSNNTMVQSYDFLLRGSQGLSITSMSPNSTVYGSTTSVPVDLIIQTDDGAENGKAICYFSTSSADSSFTTKMFETNDFKHKQSLSLQNGNYNYFFKCVDAGGNIASGNTSFSIFTDSSAPLVTRAYKQLGGLKIVTNEDAECVYSLSSCNYNFEDGQKMIYSNPDIKNNHFAEWKAKATYYIKCQDKYGNRPQSTNSCSIVVSAKQLSSQAKEQI